MVHKQCVHVYMFDLSTVHRGMLLWPLRAWAWSKFSLTIYSTCFFTIAVLIESKYLVITTEYIQGQSRNRWSVSALSSGAYTTTFLRDGRYCEKGCACTPQPHQDWADLTLMIECTSESGHCRSVYSVQHCLSLSLSAFCYSSKRVYYGT